MKALDLTLAVVLGDPDGYDISHALFLPTDEAWAPESAAFITDLDSIDDPDSGVLVVNGREFQYALGMDAVTAIVRNLLAQRHDASMDTLFEAFLFYYDNDAFLDIERGSS